MNYFYRFIIIIVLSILTEVNSEHEGDLCTTNNGKSGICKKFIACPEARRELQINRTQPKICEFIDNMPIVCCPESTTTTPTPPIIQNRVKPCEFPDRAIRVQKRNQKAHDACIDYADIIWPCKRLGTQMTREDTCPYTVKPLILKGERANDNEFPHMALLGYDDTERNTIAWDCGGTLVSDEWVMTAGHCTWHKKYAEVKHVRLGGGNKDEPADPKHLFTVQKIERHPDYIGRYIYNDIALLQLDRKVKLNSELRPACLHTGDAIRDAKAIAIGYGDTKVNGTSNFLQKVVIEKYDANVCSSYYPKGAKRSPDGLRDLTQMCYGSNEGKDTCQGDSGGPLQIYNADVYCTYTVFGVTSIGKDCGVPDLPALYTRVSAYIPWIESVVWP